MIYFLLKNGDAGNTPRLEIYKLRRHAEAARRTYSATARHTVLDVKGMVRRLRDGKIIKLKRELFEAKVLNNHARIEAIRNVIPKDEAQARRLDDLIDEAIADGKELVGKHKEEPCPECPTLTRN